MSGFAPFQLRLFICPELSEVLKEQSQPRAFVHTLRDPGNGFILADTGPSKRRIVVAPISIASKTNVIHKMAIPFT